MASNIEVPVFTNTTVWKVAFLRQTSHADTIRDDFLAIIPDAALSYADFEEKWFSELSWRAVPDVVCRKINGGEEPRVFVPGLSGSHARFRFEFEHHVEVAPKQFTGNISRKALMFKNANHGRAHNERLIAIEALTIPVRFVCRQFVRNDGLAYRIHFINLHDWNEICFLDADGQRRMQSVLWEAQASAAFPKDYTYRFLFARVSEGVSFLQPATRKMLRQRVWVMHLDDDCVG